MLPALQEYQSPAVADSRTHSLDLACCCVIRRNDPSPDSPLAIPETVLSPSLCIMQLNRVN